MAGASVFLTLSGCGNHQEYRTPSTICDVPVNQNALKDLLPEGDKLTVKSDRTHRIPEHLFCDVYVDGKDELSTEGTWQKAGFTAKQAAEAKLTFHTRSARDGQYAVWKEGATTVIDCKNASQKAETFSIEAHVVHSDGDAGDKVVSFLASLADGYKKTLPCER